ncbi:MAG: hypothetical protein FWE24_08700 [Defluviitaleaceae bacterium]|nr:hypothetical protein [Defluviitaleaceae bacterium]
MLKYSILVSDKNHESKMNVTIFQYVTSLAAVPAGRCAKNAAHMDMSIN